MVSSHLLTLNAIYIWQIPNHFLQPWALSWAPPCKSNCLFIFIHSVIQQIFIECLLCESSLPGTAMQTGEGPALLELPVLDISTWMSSKHLRGYMMKTDDMCIWKQKLGNFHPQKFFLFSVNNLILHPVTEVKTRSDPWPHPFLPHQHSAGGICTIWPESIHFSQSPVPIFQFRYLYNYSSK